MKQTAQHSFSKETLELALRCYVCLMLSIYGSGKIIGGQFHRPGALPPDLAITPITDVGGFDLAWTFFGYSQAYIVFIGLSQIIGGALFAAQRTKLMGAGILVPILLNIIIIDVCFGVSPGATFSAVAYLTAILVVLFMNRTQVTAVIRKLLAGSNSDGKKTWKLMAGRAAIVATVIATLMTAEVTLIDVLGRDNAIEMKRNEQRKKEARTRNLERKSRRQI